MNLRTTIILFSILGVSLLAFALFQIINVPTSEERREREKYLLPSLMLTATGKPLDFAEVRQKINEFTKVVIDRKAKGDQKAEQLVFERQGNTWRMVAPKNVRANSRAIDDLIDQLIRAEKDGRLSLSDDPAEYGLADPAVVVTLYRGSQATVINLGDQSPGKDPIVYVTTSDVKDPAAVSRSRISQLFASVADFRAKDLLSSPFDVVGVRLGGVARKPIELTKGADQDWTFLEPQLGEADNNAVGDFTRAIANIRVERAEDFVEDGPLPPEKLVQYGLTEDKASYLVRFQYRADPGKPGAGPAETLLIGARDQQSEQRAAAARAAAFAANLAPLSPFIPVVLPAAVELGARETLDQDRVYYFARLAGENSIVRLDGKQVKVLDKPADELRSKSLARIDTTRVDAINLTAGGETLRLRRPQLKVQTDPKTTAPAPSQWDVYTDTRAGVKTHLDTVTKLIDALNKVEVRDAKGFLDTSDKQRAWFGDEPIDLGLDRPQAEVTVWLDAIQRDKEGKPEGTGEPKLKADAKPHLRLKVGRKDEKRGVVYVERRIGDGPAAILAIPDPFVATGSPPPPSPFGQPPPPPTREQFSLSELTTGGYYAFRDRTLPSFPLDQVEKVVYTHGTLTYEVEREPAKTDGPVFAPNWLLKKPVEGKAQRVTELLTTLRNLSAEKLLTDRATERDLTELFGLGDKSAFRITVTTFDKDKKPSEYTYTIGRMTSPDSPNRNHFYARVEAKPAAGSPPESNQFVFLLPRHVVQVLDLELRDATVFTDEKNVFTEEATFTWRKPDAHKKLVETKLVLASAPEGTRRVWSVKALTVDGRDAKSDLPRLDTNKIEVLLGTPTGPRFGTGPKLSPLTTERFLVHNGPPAPAHRLDPASKDAPPPLVVELKLSGGTTRTLIIGDRWEPKDTDYPALAPRNFYYARASTLPNAVFVLPETDFKDLVAGFEFFKAQ